MNLSTVKWAQLDKTQSRELYLCSYVCALHCAQLVHTILHRTDLIIFPLALQTITIAPMMSMREGENFGEVRLRGLGVAGLKICPSPLTLMVALTTLS